MFNLAKIFGYWTVTLKSTGLTMFRSLSRSTAAEWRKVNEPIDAAAKLNAQIGLAVWRQR